MPVLLSSESKTKPLSDNRRRRRNKRTAIRRKKRKQEKQHIAEMDRLANEALHQKETRVVKKRFRMFAWIFPSYWLKKRLHS